MNPAIIGKAASQALVNWYNSSDAAHKIIIRHACIGGAIVLIPLPVVGEVAVIANQIWMYRELNKLTGVKFSENVLKCIGKFIVSQVAGVLGGVFAVLAGVAVAKCIPGLNFVAGFIAAPAAGVANYVCGKVYYEMLGGYIRNCGDNNLSDDEIIRRMKAGMVTDDKIREMQSEAKKDMKDADYAAYKDDAKKVAK